MISRLRLPLLLALIICQLRSERTIFQTRPNLEALTREEWVRAGGVGMGYGLPPFLRHGHSSFGLGWSDCLVSGRGERSLKEGKGAEAHYTGRAGQLESFWAKEGGGRKTDSNFKFLLAASFSSDRSAPASSWAWPASVRMPRAVIQR